MAAPEGVSCPFNHSNGQWMIKTFLWHRASNRQLDSLGMRRCPNLNLGFPLMDLGFSSLASLDKREGELKIQRPLKARDDESLCNIPRGKITSCAASGSQVYACLFSGHAGTERLCRKPNLACCNSALGSEKEM